MTTRTIARVALLVAVATTLAIAESLIPKPLPWLRLGLANAVALLALVRLGARAALAVTAVRVLLAGLLLGTLGGPTFALAVAGGAAALVAMVLAARAVPPLSWLGVSVIGSAAHVLGQLAAIGALFGAGRSVLTLAPWLLATAVPLGVVTGAIVVAVDRRLEAW
ncbi:MAG: Gx transporter family protein [bacterium]|nr:Gx transporter family protein [Gemmatimonadota bacterium]